MNSKKTIGCFVLSLLPMAYVNAADSQKTTGDCSPAVMAKGNVTIICGISKEEVDKKEKRGKEEAVRLENERISKEADLATTKNKPPHDISPSDSEFGDYWNHGSPTWAALQRKAGVDHGNRLIPWSEGCHYCEAERLETTTCWSFVELAKQHAWNKGFYGYNPEHEAWCKPPTSAARTELSTGKFWLE